MGSLRIISADSHVVEPPDLWEKRLGPKFGDRTPRVLKEFRGRPGPFFYDGDMVMNAHAVIGAMEASEGVSRDVGRDPAARVKFQKDAQLEGEVLNATFMSHIMYASNAPGNFVMVQEAAVLFNDWMAEYATYDPKRLICNAAVPTDDVGFAVKELERVRRKGLRGAVIHAAPPKGCPPYRDRIYDQLWAASQDLDMPITLHIVTGRVPDAIHFHTEQEIAEAPKYWVELFAEVQGILGNDFIFGGILDRFPTLKVICSEYEINWIPNFLWRIGQLGGAFSNFVQLPKTKMKPEEYFATRIWHGLVDDPFAEWAISHIGPDQIVWGSDFPHPRSPALDTQEMLAKRFTDLSPESRDKVLRGNIARAYGL